MLTCLRTRRRIGAYLDGALDDRAHRSATTHLATCGRCQRESEDLQRLRRALRRHAPTTQGPEWAGFWAGVVRGIEDDQRRAEQPARTDPSWARLFWQPRVAFGGAVGVAALVSVTLWQAFYSPVAPEAAVVVRSADTEAPGGSVMVYSPPERDLAVVWVFDSDSD